MSPGDSKLPMRITAEHLDRFTLAFKQHSHNFHGWTVFCNQDSCGSFDPLQYGHALWMGNCKRLDWKRGEEGRAYCALQRELTPEKAMALVVLKINGDETLWHGPSTKPVAVVLFQEQDDCEFAAAVQPGSQYSTSIQNLCLLPL